MRSTQHPPDDARAPSLSALPVRLFLLAVITLGVMARAATYRSPLFDFHSWRQADTAAIARNFLEERFNPLYPQIDHRGAQPHGYVETGFELHAFAVAAIARLVGFSPALGRLLNVLLFPFAALLLFGFVRRRYGETAGLVAAFLYSLGLPLTMYMDRAFMNEALLALLSIACLRAAQAYCERPRALPLLLLVLASSLIAAVKPTFLIVWGPLVALFIERFGARGLIRWEPWLAGAITMACGLLWFSHARHLFEMTGLSFGLSDKLLDLDLLFSGDYAFIVLRRLFKDVLGPIVFVFAPVGLVAAARRGRYAEAAGLATFLLYLAVVTPGNFHHNYYQLPVVPYATALAAFGVVRGLDRFARRYSWDSSRTLLAYAAVLWVAAMATFVRNVSAHNWYEVDLSRQRLCEDLAPVLRPDDRAVFVSHQNPDVLFCIGRKGWLLGAPQSTPDGVLEVVRNGGSVVVVPRTDRAVQAALEATGTRVVETPDFVAYRVTTGR